MADNQSVVYDEQGHARHVRMIRGTLSRDAAAGIVSGTAQQAAEKFLKDNASLFELAPVATESLGLRAAIAPNGEDQQLHFESEVQLMDSTVVSYNQTMFGLPIYLAGISVTLHSADNSVQAAASTLHYGIKAQAPGAGLAGQGINAAAVGAYDDLIRQALPSAKGLRINRTRLLVYRYSTSERLHKHDKGERKNSFHAEPPSLAVKPTPQSIVAGNYYVVVEALFSLKLPKFGMVNWRSFVEPESGAVLYLRALVDDVTGYVFDRDPITKTGNLANAPSATSAVLDTLRDNVSLVNLGPVSSGQQSLSGSFVFLADQSPPSPALPTQLSPFVFNYVSRTDNFAAVNAYYHCDRFFRMVQDTGFNIANYFNGTAFPLPVDHRGLGNAINAQCPGNSSGNGIGYVQFALADSNTASPMGIAADWRVVLHELGGHGILWDHVDSPNFGFSHSAGDGIAAIANDPDTAAPDRFVTFPWINIGRRHDRPVNGWGWGGVNDVGGYNSEQILATSHFRIYRSIGGDSIYQLRRVFASRSAIYLILRGVGQLTPSTNPPNALAWEQQLETADAGVWTSTNPPEVHAGGAYHKVIRWAFEKQGLFRVSGQPATVEGKPPAVDVYIDDGRHGEYAFQPNHWSCTDIWNRNAIGSGGGVHEEPIIGQTNYAYVRIKNRGTQAATNVVVKGFHCLPGVGLDFPTDWIPMTTPQLAGPNLAASDNVGQVVGPFLWAPSQVGHECMFFSVSAAGDPGNIDGHVVGPIPEWRLVPHDNNIGQRNVHPVAPALAEVPWAKLPFWIRNHGTLTTRIGLAVKVPVWVAKLGWEFDVPAITKGKLSIKPGDRVPVTVAVTAGKPLTASKVQAATDLDIVLTVLFDGAPAGGMTYRITAPKKKTKAAKVASK